MQLRSIALPKHQLPAGALQIQTTAPLIRRQIRQRSGQQSLYGQGFRLEAVKLKAGHGDSINPTIQAVLSRKSSEPAAASWLKVQAGLIEGKWQLQGCFIGLKPTEKVLCMASCRCKASGEIQQAQHHGGRRNQGCCPGSLNSPLQQQITDQIAQGLRLLRHTHLHQIWRQGHLLPTLQL